MRRLTVLGGCGAWPEPGRACSGFLLDYDGFRLVLDLGFGTLPRLLDLAPGGAVDALVITHEHSDHCVDMNALFRVHLYGEHSVRPIPLYCPPGVLDRVGALEPDADLTEVFLPHPLPAKYAVGPFQLDTMPLPHFVPNIGIRLSTSNMVLAYTGDTAPDPAVAELGAGADLFIVDATRHEPPPPGIERGVLTAHESGRYAADARAQQLLLTHFWPGTDRSVSVALAEESYSGPVHTAEEGLIIELG